MEERTQHQVDAWWRGLFGLGADLWSAVTVRPHGPALDGYDGWYVAWRGAGVHVSAPTAADADEVASLRDESALALQDPAFWQAFAQRRGLEVRGPAMHSYLDKDPGEAPGVVDVSAEALASMRAEVTAEDWEAWATEHPVHPVAVVEGERLVAAASLGPWLQHEVDIGVLVLPDRRGRGLAANVGRSCAAYAVREHGVALWRSALSNVPSVRAAERLGFEAYCTQLAIRRAGSAA